MKSIYFEISLLELASINLTKTQIFNKFSTFKDIGASNSLILQGILRARKIA